jgi:small-conductance mechanosensitive channel
MKEPTESRLRESSCRPGPLRSFAAILRDAWLAFRDARILWLLLAAIVVLFAMALSARVEPLSAGRRYLDLAARALSADMTGIDLTKDSLADVAGRLAVNLVAAAFILMFAVWVSGWASSFVQRAIGRLHRRQQVPDPTLQTFVGSMVRFGVLAVGLIAVLQQLGVQATSIIAVLNLMFPLYSSDTPSVSLSHPRCAIEPGSGQSVGTSLDVM